MRTTLICLLLLLCGCTQQPERPQIPMPQTQPPFVQPEPVAPPAPPMKIEGTYQGTWVTTNVPLNGTMKCDVTDQGNGKWKGRFYGVWRGRSFDYIVDWSGEPSNLIGKAKIDGASYQWNGQISQGQFKGTYTGNRYSGSFDLKK